MKSLWNSRGAVVAVLVVTACTSGRRSGSSGDDVAGGLEDSTVVADAVSTDDATDAEDTTSPGDIDVPPGDVTPGDVTVVDPCANGGGCDPNATCAADDDARTCTCVEVWIGPGTTCSYDGVIIRDIDTLEAGGFTTSLPADPTVYSKLVLVSMAVGIPTTYPLGAPVEGLYYVPGVPEGPYELQLWRAPNSKIVGAGPTVVILVSSERVLSIGTNFSFRAGTTILTQPTTVTVSGPLHAPWKTPTVLDDGSSSELEDELVIYSSSAFLYSVEATRENEDGEWSTSTGVGVRSGRRICQ